MLGLLLMKLLTLILAEHAHFHFVLGILWLSLQLSETRGSGGERAPLLSMLVPSCHRVGGMHARPRHPGREPTVVCPKPDSHAQVFMHPVVLK